MDYYKKLSDYEAPRSNLRVGGEIDTACTRCRRETSHTILAMDGAEPAKVQCNTCKSQHKFHTGEAPEKKSPAGERTRPRRPRPVKPAADPAAAFQNATRDVDLSRPIPYHPGQSYAIGQVLIHGKFGVGVVQGLKDAGKIIVQFNDGTRVLVHARG